MCCDHFTLVVTKIRAVEKRKVDKLNSERVISVTYPGIALSMLKIAADSAAITTVGHI